MDMTQMNSGSLAITAGTDYQVVTDGTYEAAYTGFKTYAEETPWGHKEGARLYFKITKGPFNNATVSFKGAFFQDRTTGKYVVGMKSKLAEAIMTVTGGVDTLNPGHVGTKVFINVKTNTSKKTGNVYSNVESIFPMPKYEAPATIVQNPQQTQKPTVQIQPAQKVGNPALLEGLDDLSDFTH